MQPTDNNIGAFQQQQIELIKAKQQGFVQKQEEQKVIEPVLVFNRREKISNFLKVKHPHFFTLSMVSWIIIGIVGFIALFLLTNQFIALASLVGWGVSAIILLVLNQTFINYEKEKKWVDDEILIFADDTETDSKSWRRQVDQATLETLLLANGALNDFDEKTKIQKQSKFKPNGLLNQININPNINQNGNVNLENAKTESVKTTKIFIHENAVKIKKPKQSTEVESLINDIKNEATANVKEVQKEIKSFDIFSGEVQPVKNETFSNPIKEEVVAFQPEQPIPTASPTVEAPANPVAKTIEYDAFGNPINDEFLDKIVDINNSNDENHAKLDTQPTPIKEAEVISSTPINEPTIAEKTTPTAPSDDDYDFL